MKKRKFRSIGLCVVIACLLVALSAPVAAAIQPQYKVSSAYKSSTYHQNLLSLPLVGDGAFDTLSAALSQYGYHEGASTADLHGKNTSSSGNYTEYGYAHGKVNGTYGYAWCAVFVSWCLQQAGETQSAGGAFASCSLWVAQLQEMGVYFARSTHQPRAGDLIFFRTPGVGRVSDHVGLVRYVKNGRVYTVEGNSSGQVSLRDYALGDTYIVGYGRPNYQNSAKEISRIAHEDKSVGYYVVTYDFLNVRSSRSSTSAKKGSLAKGDVIRVQEIKNGWGSIEYKGSVAYISLEYAIFVAPSTHTLSYQSEGKTLLTREILSTDAPVVASFTPEREGYEFVGWQDANAKEYTAAQSLPVTDLVLTAQWREIPPPPSVEEETQDSVTPPVPPQTPEPPQDEAEIAVPSEPVTHTPDFTLASRITGVLVTLLAGTWIGLWIRIRKRKA